MIDQCVVCIFLSLTIYVPPGFDSSVSVPVWGRSVLTTPKRGTKKKRKEKFLNFYVWTQVPTERYLTSLPRRDDVCFGIGSSSNRLLNRGPRGVYT